jgi:hypothetical protein
MNYVPDYNSMLQRAKEGCPESIMLVGFYHYLGEKCSQDIDKSLKYFRWFYSINRADTKSLVDDYRYYSFMAQISIDCLNHFYLKESKELFERVLVEGGQILPNQRMTEILKKYRVEKILNSIEFVESNYNYVQTDFLPH